ncbi:FKBP-type peptidyl-prolyl cis-trans isomerase [Ruficoccus amylovorans]|nr:FKBP-type peptidyl-prolyl cis-trans isomerase [Ruficoccus amylovorans]
MRLYIGKTLTTLAAASLIALSASAQTNDEAPKATSGSNTELLKNYGWIVTPDPDRLGISDEEKAAFLAGVQAHLDGESGPADPQAAWQEIQQYLTQRFVEMNKEKGKEFLNDLKSNPKVKKSASGLYYEIIAEGEGPKAGPNDTVKVDYVGTLVDGTEFDSSYKRGQPATFPVSGVVPGFGEGVQLVGKGGKVKLYIPSELGYGDRAQPGSPIPPGSTLVFEVEMVEVNPQ